MNKFNEIPEGLIVELVQKADSAHPFPKEGDTILSDPVVMSLGHKYYVGVLRMEYDVYAGWIPLPHEMISDFFPTKAQAIDKYVELASEAKNDVSKSRPSNTSCSS